MNVTLPDGTVLEGVPDGTTKAQLLQKLKTNGYDTTGLEPKPRDIKDKYAETAEDQNFLQNLAAGAGGAVTGVGMGLRQMNPFGTGPSDDEVREYQASMSGLRGTVGGTIGEIGAYLVPSVGGARVMGAIPTVSRLLAAGGGKALGAATGMAATEGAVTGALRPVNDEESRVENIVKDAAFNAVVPSVIAGGGKATSVVREMFAPFMGQTAKNVSAARLIKRASGAKYGESADDVITALQAPTPFFKPSVSQATVGLKNRNIAGLQRAAEREFPDAMGTRVDTQRMEREGLIRSFAGDDAEIARMRTVRGDEFSSSVDDAQEAGLLGRYTREALDIPPRPVEALVPSNLQPGMTQRVLSAGEVPTPKTVPILEKLRVNPLVNASIDDAKAMAKGNLGLPESMKKLTQSEIDDVLVDPMRSIKGLQLMKFAIDNRLAPSMSGSASAAVKIKDSAAANVKSALMQGVKQTGIGGEKFIKANERFAEQSDEIFQKKVGQNMLALLQKPLGEAESGAKLARAIEAETALVKKSGGLGRSGLDEKLTPENAARVNKVISQLDVDETVRELSSVGVSGKAVKELTGETLSLPNLMNASVALANGAFRRIFGMSKEGTMKNLAEMMQDPAMAAKYMQLATKKEQTAIKVINKLMTYTPVVAASSSGTEQ